MENKEKALEILNELQNSLVSQMKAYGLPTDNLSIKIIKEKVVVLIKGDVDTQKAAERLECPEIILAAGLCYSVEGRGSEAGYFLTWSKSNHKNEEEEAKMKEGMHRLETAADFMIAEFRILFRSKFDDILLASIEGKTAADMIPLKAKKFYQTEGGLQNITNWKAQLLVGGNINDDDKIKMGDFDSVGYVMVNVDNCSIIPVGRGDEHHTGFELVRHLISKKIIPMGNYYPIFYSHTYVYDSSPKGTSTAVRAFKIWRALGGGNIPIESASSHGQTEFMVRVDDYIKRNGQIENKTGELAPVGKQMVRHLEKLAQMFVRIHSGETVKESLLFNEAWALFGVLTGTFHYLDAQNLASQLPGLIAKGDTKNLESLIFGHSGYKNIVHMSLKKAWEKYSERQDNFYIRNEIRVFGDVSFAVQELNRLGYQY